MSIGRRGPNLLLIQHFRPRASTRHHGRKRSSTSRLGRRSHRRALAVRASTPTSRWQAHSRTIRACLPKGLRDRAHKRAPRSRRCRSVRANRLAGGSLPGLRDSGVRIRTGLRGLRAPSQAGRQRRLGPDIGHQLTGRASRGRGPQHEIGSPSENHQGVGNAPSMMTQEPWHHGRPARRLATAGASSTRPANRPPRGRSASGRSGSS